MPETPNDHKQIPSDVHRTEHASAFRNAFEMEAKMKREEEEKERKRQAAAEEAAYHAREEYAKELTEEKIDLIRLKQGVITESDKVFREEEPQKQYTLWQKIGNWFYHSKWWLGIASFCVLLGAFLIYDYVSKENPDLNILILTDHPTLYAESDAFCDWLETMCPDYNTDQEVLVHSIYIPVNEQTMEMSGNYSASYNTQLLVQFQTSTCMLVLADDRTEAYLQPKDLYMDLTTVFPDCPYVNGYRLELDQTDFAEQFGLSEPLKENSYLALRIPAENMNSLEENQTEYNHAKELLGQIISCLHTKGAVS